MNIRTGPPTEGEWLPWEKMERPDDNKAFFVWGKDPHETGRIYLYLWHPWNADDLKLVNLTTGISRLSLDTWLFKPVKNYAIVVTGPE